LKTQLIDINKIIPYSRNPRNNDESVDNVASSIKEFGFRQPIVVDEDFVVLAGHTRLKASKKLNLKEVPVHMATDLSDGQKKAFRLMDNRSAEDSKWDDKLLSLELVDLKELGLDLDITGFTEREIVTALNVEESYVGLTDDNEVPEAPEKAKTKTGDLWSLGESRLVCGDATNEEDVERLMEGEKADMVFTDPPYGIFLDTDYSKMRGGIAPSHKYEKVIGDSSDFDFEAVNTILKKFDYCKEIFIWGADYFADLIPNRNTGSWIVWDKRTTENFDKTYGSAFELCWSKQKHKRIIARILWAGIFGMGKEHDKKRVHPTQKPVALLEWFLDYFSLKDKKNVVDLFGGSGSTLIACQKHKKKGFLMEIEPKYCDVIIKRWEDFTGEKAQLIKK
jgi:DNA modification methylase